jgi:hypothetical protein
MTYTFKDLTLELVGKEQTISGHHRLIFNVNGKRNVNMIKKNFKNTNIQKEIEKDYEIIKNLI